MLKKILEDRNMSIYQLSQKSKIPYSTLNNIVNKKCKIEDCKAKTIRSLADALDMSMDKLYDLCKEKTYSEFEIFKQNIQHRLCEKGMKEYLIYLLKSDIIDSYWEKNNILYARYLVAMCDYLCRLLNVDKYNKYDEIRKYKMKDEIYPLSVVQGLFDKEECKKESIQEFKECNIMEVNIFNVR